MSITGWKKMITGSIVTILSASMILGSLVSAQSTQGNPTPSNDEQKGCPACTSTPPMIASHRSFVNEVITIITNPQMSAAEIFVASLIGGSEAVTAQRQADLKSQLSRIRGIQAAGRQQQGIINETFRTLQKNTAATKQTLQAITYIGKTFVASNPGLGRAILTKPKSVRRDRETLLTIDDRIQAVYLEVSTKGELLADLDPRQRTALLQLFEKYSGDQGFLVPGGSSIQGNATYKDLLKMLRSTNAAFKRFLAIGGLVELLSDDVKELSKGGVTIMIDRSKALVLRENYECSKKIGMCTSSFSTFGQAMQGSSTEIASAGKTAASEIRESIIALQYAIKGKRYKKAGIALQCQREIDPATGKEMWVDGGGGTPIYYRYLVSVNGGKPSWVKGPATTPITSHQPISESAMKKECNLTTREIEAKPDDRAMMEKYLIREQTLLGSQYGIYVDQATVDKSIWGIFQPRNESQTDTLKNEETIKAGSNLDSFNEQNTALITKENTKQEKKIMDEIMSAEYDLDGSKILAINTLESDIRAILNQTQAEQITLTQQTINADVRPTTQAIAAMTQKVRYITELIGDKQNPASIQNLLGKSCDLQCGNLGGRCWAQ